MWILHKFYCSSSCLFFRVSQIKLSFMDFLFMVLKLFLCLNDFLVILAADFLWYTFHTSLAEAT